jgi:hypothetical protein
VSSNSGAPGGCLGLKQEGLRLLMVTSTILLMEFILIIVVLRLEEMLFPGAPEVMHRLKIMQQIE